MLCLKCANAMDRTPTEEEIVELYEKEMDERVQDRLNAVENKEEVNLDELKKEIVEEIKEMIEASFRITGYKYKFFCKARKNVVVGDDSPTKSIRVCKDFVEKS